MATRNLFEGFEPELRLAQCSGCSGKVNNLIESRIRSYAGGLVRQFPALVNEKEDLAQQGLLIFWRDIKRFLFICPLCGVSTSNRLAYQEHCVSHHGELIHPKSDLGLFLSSRVKSHMRSLVRSEFAQKRDRRKTIQAGLDVSWEWESGDANPEAQAATREAAAKLRELMAEELDHRVLEVLVACLDGLEGADIYRRLVEVGLYGSMDSARHCIQKLRQKGAFKKYARVLSPA